MESKIPKIPPRKVPVKRNAEEAKVADKTKRSKSRKMSKVAKSATESREDQVFRFLDLPAELRNNIYEKVVEGLPQAYLNTRTRSNLASRSALPRVSRQIRKEFLPVLYLCAPEIMATVKDFNFSHIVTFLNRLSETEVKGLTSVEAKSDRKMLIELDFGENTMFNFWPSAETPAQSLLRWARRTEHPTKKGTGIDITYVVVGTRRSQLSQLNSWISVHISQCEKTRRKERGKGKAEMQKMRDVINAAYRNA